MGMFENCVNPIYGYFREEYVDTPSTFWVQHVQHARTTYVCTVCMCAMQCNGWYVTLGYCLSFDCGVS